MDSRSTDYKVSAVKIGRSTSKNLIKKEYKMVETMLMLILVLVVYNSTLWENGEYDTSKSNWVYWRDK